jgi:hypothetical protein
MPKSLFAQNLDLVQRGVHSFLRSVGFRKKGRSHNRLTKGRLRHVITFQLSKYAMIDGQMAVNLGVLIPCVFEAEWQRPPPDVVREYHCTIRSRLGALSPDEDNWFHLGGDTDALARTLIDLFSRSGLPFFDHFQSYEDVLAHYNTHGDLPFQGAARATLEAALIANHLGQKELSQSLFAKAYATDHPGFQKHVAELAQRVGQPIL